MSKYHSRKTVINGVSFASKAEATAYSNRLLLQQEGHISGLELQPRFPVIVNGKLICTYIADFRYKNHATNSVIVEDVKGYKTPVYRLKKKLVEALYGITILESSGDDIPF